MCEEGVIVFILIPCFLSLSLRKRALRLFDYAIGFWLLLLLGVVISDCGGYSTSR